MSNEIKRATRTELLKIALSWKNTPWGHQQSIKGLAADCCGFVEGVGREGGYPEVLGFVRDYRRNEDGERMLYYLDSYTDFLVGNTGREVPDLSMTLPMDIVAFCNEHLRHPEIPRHLAFITEKRHDGVIKIIHAGDERRGVIHHHMDLRWRQRIHSVWAIRGLER